MRRLAIALALLALLLLGLRLALRPLLASDAFRDLVVSSASEGLGLELSTAEPLRPSLSLLPGVDAAAVRIRSPEDASWRLDAQAGRVEVRIHLWPLLRGELEVVRLEIADADVRYALPASEATGPSDFDLAGLLDALPRVTHLGDTRLVRGFEGAGDPELWIESLTLRRCGRDTDFAGRVGALPVSFAARLECPGPLALHLAGLDARVAGTALRGDLDLDLSARTHVSGSLETPRLELADTSESDTSSDPEAWLDRALPYGALETLDLDLALRAGSLLLGARRFDDGDAKLALQDGRLELEAKARLGDAKLEIALRAADEGGGQVGVEARVEGLPLAPLVGIPETTGDYSGALALAGRGRTPRQILASSDGSLDFSLGEVRFPDALLGPLGRDVVYILGSQLRSPRPTHFQCAILHSDVQAGLGTPTALVVDTPDMTLAGGGVIDLRRLALDLRIRPKPKRPGVLSLKTPIRIAGPLSDLRAGIDSAALAKATGRMLSDGLLDPRVVASVFVDLGSDADACDLDLARETSSRAGNLLDHTTRALRGAGSWVYGVFDQVARPD